LAEHDAFFQQKMMNELPAVLIFRQSTKLFSDTQALFSTKNLLKTKTLQFIGKTDKLTPWKSPNYNKD
jgi:hypothetical protein